MKRNFERAERGHEEARAASCCCSCCIGYQPPHKENARKWEVEKGGMDGLSRAGTSAHRVGWSSSVWWVGSLDGLSRSSPKWPDRNQLYERRDATEQWSGKGGRRQRVHGSSSLLGIPTPGGKTMGKENRHCKIKSLRTLRAAKIK